MLLTNPLEKLGRKGDMFSEVQMNLEFCAIFSRIISPPPCFLPGDFQPRTCGQPFEVVLND